MGQLIEINQGEVVVKFTSPTVGKLSFSDLGIKTDDLAFEGGFLRLVFDMEGTGEHSYFAIPTIEVSYKENMDETHWQCDFNGETILDKTDNHGNSTIILMDRKKLAELEHHHENTLILHAEFPEGVHIVAEDSYINFFK
jgi:hypothetical protein